jgi:arabinofuranan 3-O-arabinosyltransferase
MAVAAIEKKRVFLARPIELACIALVIAQAVYLAASYWYGTWILAPDGKGVPSDFVNVWAAGDLVLQGKPLARV